MLKSRPVEFKAIGSDGGLAEGQFKALVSVFNNVDSTGDMVMPGAFANTLADWKTSGKSIPIYYSHQMQDPDMNIGWVLEAEETDQGLEVLGQLDVPDGSAKATQTYRLMKGDRVTDFSFAYDVIDQSEKDGYNELHELKLYEVGPTPIGANDQTELLAVKRWAETQEPVVRLADLHLKVGRTLSAKNENTLRDAVAALEGAATSIKNVLASIDAGGSTTDDEEGKANHPSEASDTGPVKDDEPQQAKSDEPSRRASAERWETRITLTDLEGSNHA